MSHPIHPFMQQQNQAQAMHPPWPQGFVAVPQQTIQLGMTFDPSLGPVMTPLYPPYMLASHPDFDATLPAGSVPNRLTAIPTDWGLARLAESIGPNGSLDQLQAFALASGRRRLPMLQTDPIKHRRTRSGCLTCRGRRVKCDETRPICERCRKGNRECTYPERSSTKSKRGSGSTASGRPSPSTATSESPTTVNSPTEPVDTPFPPIDKSGHLLAPTIVTSLDLTDFDDQSPLSGVPGSGLRPDESPVSSVECSSATTPGSASFPATKSSDDLSASWLADADSTDFTVSTNLSAVSDKRLNFGCPPDFACSDKQEIVQYYSAFHQRHITAYHYGVAQPPDHFLTHTFLDLAASNRQLLYAILAISSYYHSVIFGAPDIAVFATFQILALRSLREATMSDLGPSVPTLLSVLLLAKLEELTASRSTLLLHRQAARWMISNLVGSTDPLDPAFVFAVNVCFNIEQHSNAVVGAISNDDIDWFIALEQPRLGTSMALNGADGGDQFGSLRNCHLVFLSYLQHTAQGSMDLDGSEFTSRVEDYVANVASLESGLCAALENSPVEQAALGSLDSTPFGSRLKLIVGNQFERNVGMLDNIVLYMINLFHASILAERTDGDDRLESVISQLHTRTYQLLLTACRLIESLNCHCLAERPAGLLAAIGPMVASIALVVPTVLTFPHLYLPTDNLDAYVSLGSFLQSRSLDSVPVGYQIPMDGDVVQWVCQKLSEIEKAGYHFSFAIRDAITTGLGIESLDEFVSLSESDDPFTTIPHPDHFPIYNQANAFGTACLTESFPPSTPGLISPNSGFSRTVSQELRAYVRNRGYTTGAAGQFPTTSV